MSQKERELSKERGGQCHILWGIQMVPDCFRFWRFPWETSSLHCSSEAPSQKESCCPFYCRPLSPPGPARSRMGCWPGAVSESLRLMRLKRSMSVPKGSQGTLVWPWSDILQVHAGGPGPEHSWEQRDQFKSLTMPRKKSEAPGEGSTRNEKRVLSIDTNRREGAKRRVIYSTWARFSCWIWASLQSGNCELFITSLISTDHSWWFKKITKPYYEAFWTYAEYRII